MIYMYIHKIPVLQCSFSTTYEYVFTTEKIVLVTTSLEIDRFLLIFWSIHRIYENKRNVPCSYNSTIINIVLVIAYLPALVFVQILINKHYQWFFKLDIVNA